MLCACQSVSENDLGTYKCVASNELGSKLIEIKVEGKVSRQCHVVWSQESSTILRLLYSRTQQPASKGRSQSDHRHHGA